MDRRGVRLVRNKISILPQCPRGRGPVFIKSVWNVADRRQPTRGQEETTTISSILTLAIMSEGKLKKAIERSGFQSRLPAFSPRHRLEVRNQALVCTYGF